MAAALSSLPRKQILLVDDDEDIREIVAEILADHGYEVRLAHNGREALRILDETTASPPELILLDLMMPELDGAQFLAVLDENPVHQGIPIIVVTASRKDAPPAVRHKVVAWLPKPVEYEQLVATVGKYVGTRRPVPVAVPVAPAALASVVPLVPRSAPRRTRDVSSFLARREAELDTLRACLAGAEYLEIRRLGHNLKGVGTSFGFPELSELGHRLENAAHDADEPLMRTIIDELAAYVVGVRGRAPGSPVPDPQPPR